MRRNTGMNLNGSLKNPVLLYNLIRQDVRDTLDGQVIIAEDVHYKDSLIVKAGTFLDEKTIYRLINLGIKRVNILLFDDYKKTDLENISILQFKKQYLNNQKCIIADKDVYQINELISVVAASHIIETNIFAVNNSIPIRKLIEDKQPKYIFIDLNLYPNHGLKVIKEIKRFTNAHIFLTALVDQTKVELVNKLKKEVDLQNAKLLLKPVSPTELRLILLDTVTNKDIKKFLLLRKYYKNKSKTA